METLFWKNIQPGNEPPNTINAIVECPKGSKNKYELSKNTNLLILDRILHSSVVYPADYGLIPGTFADDDDPLDILILTSNPSSPLTIVEVRPIAVLLMEDEKGLDEKILSVSLSDPFFQDYSDIGDIPIHYLDEIQEFFRTYKNLEEPKYATIKEWKDKEFAQKLIIKAINSFISKYGDIAKINPF